jgi:hypothetical protein
MKIATGATALLSRIATEERQLVDQLSEKEGLGLVRR